MLPYFLLSALNQAVVATQMPYVQIFLRNKGYSFSLIGVIVALGQICSIVFPLLVGSFADKTGKSKWIMLGCSVLSFCFIVPVLLSSSVAISIICYCLMCATFYCVNPITDGVLSSQSQGHPGRYSYMRAVGTLSYVLILILFALIKWPNPESNKSIMWGILIFSFLFWISVLLIPSTDAQKKQNSEGKLFDFGWFGKSFYIFILIVALSRITQTVVERFLSSYMTEVLKVGGNFTLFYSLSAGSEFVMMIIGGKLLEKKKITGQGLVGVSCIAAVLRMIILCYFPSITGLAIAQLFHSFTFGGVHVGTAAFINSHVEKEHYGMAMSFYWAIGNNFPMMLGALAGGYVIDLFGYPSLFLSYSLFSLVAFALFLIFKKTLYSEV